MLRLYIMLFLFLFFNACSVDNATDGYDIDEVKSEYIYYGDITNNDIVKINIETMKSENFIKSNGIYPYEIANGFDNQLLVLNRADTKIGILENDYIESEYFLEFEPRSISLNQDTKTILLSSSSEPSMGLLPTTNIYNDSTYKEPNSFGGAGATGHPHWINETYFLLLDRTENSIELYNVDSPNVVAKLTTSSSVHHIEYVDGFYYGNLEGVRGGVSPGMIKFEITYGKFESVTQKLISEFSEIPTDFSASNWGSHHFSFHPDNKHIYIGSYEGNVFVIDSSDMSLVDSFKSGRGVGHFLFYKDILITTNHYDNFKSFYNVSNPNNNILIKELQFSSAREDGIIMQSHTSHLIDNNLYFMYNIENESRFYKISLDDYSVVEYLTLPQRYCVMGVAEETINQHTSSM